MPSDFLQAALEKWNKREYDPTVNRVVAHMKQVEWENQQLLKQMEEVKRIYSTDLTTVKRDDRIAIVEYYDEQLRVARQRATMMEEALTVVKQTMEEEPRMDISTFVAAHREVQSAKHGNDSVYIGLDPANRWWVSWNGKDEQMGANLTEEQVKTEAHKLIDDDNLCSLVLDWRVA
jgi:hypothetical protein